MSSTDVVVVGCGPAGASTALHLARAGIHVTVIDKATFPRDKCCGDGLTTAALRQLEELGLDPSKIPSWRVITETIWQAPSGHVMDLPVPDDGVRIAVARRTELDAALVDLVRAAGVDVHEGAPLVSAKPRGNGMRVVAGDLEPIDCSYVIGADGMWSALRKHVRTDREHYLGEFHAFRQYFTNVTGIGRHKLWVSFERDLIPGYVWSFPVDENSVNVGFGVIRKPNQSVAWMKTAWPDILGRSHMRDVLGDAVPESPHKAWPIPARLRSKNVTELDGRVMFVGDAARAADPLTGEGIAQALESGKLVADAIAGASGPRHAGARYRRRVDLGMAIDNAFAGWVGRVISHETALEAAFRAAPNGPWKGRYAVKWTFEDNPRAGLLTPWRWPKRFSRKTGAFR